MLSKAAGDSGSERTESVRLVCGTVNGKGEASRLAAIVMDRLRENPMNGETYAFCDKAHDTVRTLQCIGGTFKLTTIRKPRGERYIWPPGELGLSVSVTGRALDYLIAYRKAKSRYAEKD